MCAIKWMRPAPMGWKTKEEHNAYQRRYRRARGVRPRIVRPPRLCEVCGNALRLQNRRFCSAACYEFIRTDQRLTAWLAGELNPSDATALGRVPKWIKLWWIATFGDQCALCGWSQRHPATGRVPLEWDHIDGDCSNNRCQNLRLLCPNCHALTETHGGLNNGRSKRRRKWAGTVIITRT
jgi:hypothetical protein